MVALTDPNGRVGRAQQHALASLHVRTLCTGQLATTTVVAAAVALMHTLLPCLPPSLIHWRPQVWQRLAGDTGHEQHQAEAAAPTAAAGTTKAEAQEPRST